MTNITTTIRPSTPDPRMRLGRRARIAASIGAAAIAGIVGAAAVTTGSDSEPTTTDRVSVPADPSSTAARAVAGVAGSDASSRLYARMSPDAAERWASAASPVSVGRPYVSADAVERWAEAEAAEAAEWRGPVSADAAERWASGPSVFVSGGRAGRS